MAKRLVTTAEVVARPTPSAPPRAARPRWHAMRAMLSPNTEAGHRSAHGVSQLPACRREPTCRQRRSASRASSRREPRFDGPFGGPVAPGGRHPGGSFSGGRGFGDGHFGGRPFPHGHRGPGVFVFPYFYDPYYGYDPYYPGYPYAAYCDPYSPSYAPQYCYWDGP